MPAGAAPCCSVAWCGAPVKLISYNLMARKVLGLVNGLWRSHPDGSPGQFLLSLRAGWAGVKCRLLARGRPVRYKRGACSCLRNLALVSPTSRGVGTCSVGCATSDVQYLLTPVGIPSSWFGSGLAGCVVPSTKGSWVWGLVDESFGKSWGSSSRCLRARMALSMSEPAGFAPPRCLCVSCSSCGCGREGLEL